MTRKDEELLKKLLPMFKIEAQDHLKVISSGLIQMEKSNPEKQVEIIEAVFRESHSLKGAARSVSLPNVAAVCQAMESVFFALKQKRIAPSSNVLDALHNAVDCASRLVYGEGAPPPAGTNIGELVQRLEAVAHPPAVLAEKEEKTILPAILPPADAPGEKSQPEPPEAVSMAPRGASVALPPHFLSSSIRVSTEKLDSLLLQAEEMLSVKIAISRLASELKELHKSFARWEKETARRKSLERLRPGISPFPSSDDSDSFIASFGARVAGLAKAAEYDQRSLGAMVDSLLDDAKKTLMLPLDSLLEMFPKLARDLSRDAGKDVELTASGGEIEIDRRVLEQIKDPLIHMVRNCIDHGIETPEERKGKNKPRRGSIRIAASSNDGKMEIAVSDDGAGIDAIKVRSAARRSGAVSKEEAGRLDEGEALALIFRSGVSTSRIITDISGRGLGLAIVRECVEKLNGDVSFDTRPDTGTTIKVVVPISIATFRGVLVRVGENLFVIPSANVERVTRVRREEIATVENRETIPFAGRPVSLVRLGAVLGLQAAKAPLPAEGPYVQVVALASGGKRIAFQVDEVIDEREVLVRNLGPQLARVRNIAGATLLGSGKVVPILNIPDLMVSAAGAASFPGAAADPVRGEPQGTGDGPPLSTRLSVLVVEDSITARALLKSILESAGYEVTTAVDGMDALAALETRRFDLVVSDIEMPRMNGFDLTARIRADRKLSEIPVVLVTALESRENRERGIDVGANAYIVKSSFEQSNLLEVIQRFI